MNENARCCHAGERFLTRDADQWVIAAEAMAGTNIEIQFCPWCGWNLDLGYWPGYESFRERLRELLEAYRGPSLRICFDIDGVLAVQGKPFAERDHYRLAKEILGSLQAAGHEVVAQTARHMTTSGQNQSQADLAGREELVEWLREKDIRIEEVHFGKTSAHLYLDDNGCRVRSMAGIMDWANNFLPALGQTMDYWANTCQLTSTSATPANTTTKNSDT